MAAAAVVATQRLLVENPPYERVARYGTALMDLLPALAAKHGVELAVRGVPAAFHASTAEPDGYAALWPHLVRQGLWVMQRGIWFVSAAHGDAELEDTRDRVEAALAAV